MQLLRNKEVIISLRLFTLHTSNLYTGFLSMRAIHELKKDCVMIKGTARTLKGNLRIRNNTLLFLTGAHAVITQ